MMFEKDVASRYKITGYDVVSNLIIELHRRKMELDILALKDNEVVLVSCKNMSQVRKIDYIVSRIRENANLIEHRIKLLGVCRGKIHIKVHSSVYSIIKNKLDGYWVPSMYISIEK